MSKESGWVLTLLATLASYTVLVVADHAKEANGLAGTMALVLLAWAFLG